MERVKGIEPSSLFYRQNRPVLLGCFWTSALLLVFLILTFILTCPVTGETRFLMASLTKHPKSRYWTACYTNAAGKQVKRSTKLTIRSKAMKVALQFEENEQHAKEGVATAVQLQKVVNELAQEVTGESLVSPTVTEFLNEWIIGKKKNSATGTVERYGHTVRQFLKHLGNSASIRVIGLTPKHIESFLDARLAEGVAPKTAIVDVKTLRSAFNRAERLGIILKNPVNAVELPDEKSSERGSFTHEQIEKLLSTAPSEDWRTLIYLGYYTGARLSDCVALTWNNVDGDRKVIRYSQKKTGKDVVMPIHVELFERLCWLSEFGVEGPLCNELSNKGPGGKHGLSESFKRIVKKAGIDQGIVQGKGARMFTTLTFHSLRHSFNSTLANAGVSQEIRCKLTGHTSFAMNDKYTKFNIPPLQSAIENMPMLESSLQDQEASKTVAKPAKKRQLNPPPTVAPNWDF